jgi:hypothetical protein
MNEKTKKIILIVIGSIIKIGSTAAITAFLLKWWRSIVGAVMMIGIFFGLLIYELISPIILFMTPEPPKPLIEYGEFPFEIVYSVNGEVFNKTGKLRFKYRTYTDYDRLEKKAFWEGYYLNDPPYLLHQVGSQYIYIDCGQDEYYMMNEKPYDGYEPGEYFYYYVNYKKTDLTPEEAKEKFGIEIISKKFSEPLKNNEYENIIIHSLKKLFKAE